MATSILLEGDNLGERHRHLNRLVCDAFGARVPVQSVRDLAERSDVDRLFNIDLADKYRHVEYILENLRSDDMLHVSRALRSTWLITDARYEDIVNPTSLHERIYPSMTVPAAGKLAHAVQLALKDERRCEVFYLYYAEKKSELAIKYLPKCSGDFILNELKTKEINPSPHLLKMLCEKNPHVAEYYFERLVYEGKTAHTYAGDQEKFLKSVRFLMKTNPDIYFDILERLHLHRFDRLTEKATHFVMKTQLRRFEAKPELYATQILNLDVVARYLSDERLKELILTLARAEYLGGWLTYKSAEPLLKRLSKEGKSAFVKSIFVEKSFGSPVKVAPYEFPKAPELKPDSVHKIKLDICESYYDCDMEFAQPMAGCMKKKITKRCIKQKSRGHIRSLMDDLYDSYRFANFSKTFFELRKRIQREPSHSNRQIMLTVLITKSKSSEENIKCLLEYFLQKHLNEPITLKCSFARTLVNQAKAYKFGSETWNLLEQVFDNIGAFGECEENISPCIEAILIYSVLNRRRVPDVILNKYLSSFSTLNEYSLSATEKENIFNFVFTLLHDKIESNLSRETAADAVGYVFNMISLIEQWNKSVVDYGSVLELIKRLTATDAAACESLLSHLYYKIKGHRKLFLNELFPLQQDQQSYSNALKQDASLLARSVDKFDAVLEGDSFCHEKFLRKIIIYFQHDLAITYLRHLEAKVDTLKKENVAKNVARALCVLNSRVVHRIIESGCDKKIIPRSRGPTGQLEPLVKQVNFNKIVTKHLFLVRPPIAVDVLLALREAATVPLTTAVYRHQSDACRTYVRRLADGPRQFAKLAITLAYKKLGHDDIIQICRHVWQNDKSNKTRLVLLKETHKYMRTAADFPIQLWEFLKVVIQNLNLKQKDSTYETLATIDTVPDRIKVDYCQTVYGFFRSVKNMMSTEKLAVNREWQTSIVHFVNEQTDRFPSSFLDDILREFLTEYFIPKRLSETFFLYDRFNRAMLYLIPNYLLSCETLDEQTRRYETIGKPFVHTIKTLQQRAMKTYVFRYLNTLNKCMDIKKLDATSVIEKLSAEMEESLLLERNFGFYISVRMSLVHAQALKAAAEENPDFITDSSKQMVLLSRINYHLGKYMCSEVDKLCGEYRLSGKDIAELYLRKYSHAQLRDYAWRQDCQLSLVEGFLAQGGSTCGLVFCVEYLATQLHHVQREQEPTFLGLIEKMKERRSDEVNIYIYAKLTDTIARLDTPKLA